MSMNVYSSGKRNVAPVACDGRGLEPLALSLLPDEMGLYGYSLC